MSDLLTTPELRSEPVKEPAKRWRNLWRARDDLPNRRCTSCGGSVARKKPGTVFISHCRVWPSRAAAESSALEIIAAQAGRGYEPDEHLGAFPIEGEGS